MLTRIVEMRCTVRHIRPPPGVTHPADQLDVRLFPRPLKLGANCRYVTNRPPGPHRAVAHDVGHGHLNRRRFAARFTSDNQGQAKQGCRHNDGDNTRMALRLGFCDLSITETI